LNTVFVSHEIHAETFIRYTAALMQKPTDVEEQVIKRNRALAYLKTGQFDAALTDTNFPNFGPQPSEKALFRAAEALYQLNCFQEARQVVEKLCDYFPDNTRATEVLERTRSRCAEQTIGDYNFKRMQTAARKSRPPQLDHATYIGPVEVRPVANKGRGLFVTKAVRAGDLLLCEKAFSYAWVGESAGESSRSHILLDNDTGRGFAGGQAELITKIVHKLHRNPSLGQKFRILYHGDYKSAESFVVDGEPIVDT
jgi:tetratricopeptide (TPR) repeat protein